MTTPILPGFTVDQTMYETAANGIATLAADLAPLTWDKFTAPASWLLIPDEQGEISKAEMILTCSVQRTVKLNIWYRPDVRGGAKIVPHNHRWDTFCGNLLLGGYDEDRYTRTAVDAATGRAHVEAELGVTHDTATANEVPHDVFHEVTRVHEPGRTMSLMVCGRGEFGNWCHLDVDTGRLVREQPVAGFDDMFAVLNPHHR
jgi:hypothetical protein